MGTGYFIYHGIRLARQAVGIARESRRLNASADVVDAATAERYRVALLGSIAATEETRLRHGPHHWVRPTPENVPDIVEQARHKGMSVFGKCVECGLRESDVVHKFDPGR